MIKNPPANEGDARDMGSIPRMGRSPGVGNGKLLQYSCLENSMERGAWWAKESWTQLSTQSTQPQKQTNKKQLVGGFPGDAVGKNLPANAGDTDLIPGL